MTGLVGGRVSPATRDEMHEALHEEPWYDTERFAAGDLSLGLVHHGERDPGGHATWDDGTRAGVVHGAVVAPDRYREAPAALLEDLLADPAGTMPDVEGCFLLAAVDDDADRAVVATDKLGTRQAYYHEGTPFAFATGLGPLVSVLDDPTPDPRAISDMALIGQVWGEKTLLAEASHVPSGSVLVDDGDGPTVTRYWEHAFEQDPSGAYVDDLVESYRSVVGATGATVDDGVGLWLSGGMDSRAMAAELNDACESLTTYTYDANPPQAGNLEQAARVSELLGAENVQVPVSGARFGEMLDDAVDLTDGMVGLVTFANISAAFELPEDRPGVVLEACGQGGMMGDGIGRAAIERASSPEDALYTAKHLFDVDGVRRVLDTQFDPMRTYREEVARSDQPDLYGTVMDVYYRNYFPRGDFASNPVARSQVGTRVPFAHSEFLDAVTDMPLEHRVGSVPLTRGRVPLATAPMKLELVRRLDRGLEEIPYQRTKVAPKRPLWQHGVGFVVGTGLDRLRGKMTYGGRSMVGEWYRAGGAFADRLDDALAAAAERPYLDGAEVRRLRREHLERESEHIGALSGIATPEIWFDRHLE